jgi:molybdenum cofactor cytidylyltransferase
MYSLSSELNDIDAHFSLFTWNFGDNRLMKFEPVSLDSAEGKILGHNIADVNGQRLMRKGKPLTPSDIQKLREIGRTSIYVADLEEGDVGEDKSASDVAAAVMGRGLHSAGAAGGRVNLLANALGVARIDTARLNRINEIEGITIATVVNHAAVERRQIAATIKIIPFAIPRTSIEHVKEICLNAPPVSITELPTRMVTLILSGSPSAKERIIKDFDSPIRERVTKLGSQLNAVEFVPLEDEAGETALALRLEACARNNCGLVVLAGETAIMDRHDIAPRAIARAGGEVTCFGAPVDPGNLMMVGYIGSMSVLGAPGCARSRKFNVVDWVMPRLLAGDRIERKDIVGLGVGGLLEEIAERPMPRGDSRG